MRPNVIVLVVCLCLGCGGSSDAPPMAKVAGIANFDGNPLADAMVTFYPEKGPPGVGRTDATGAFQIRTNGQLGAAVGKHKVTVASSEAAAEPPPMDGNEVELIGKSTLPTKYNSPETTDLQLDIPPEGNLKVVLDLTP